MKKREEILLAVPDLRAWKDEEGWNIELCREERQVIQAESCYEELKKTTEDPLVKSYLKEKTERVRFLKTAVAKRRETLVQVAKFLLEKQEAWLEVGGEKETVTMEAVSYTHLDVYKRQGLSGASGSGDYGSSSGKCSLYLSGTADYGETGQWFQEDALPLCG